MHVPRSPAYMLLRPVEYWFNSNLDLVYKHRLGTPTYLFLLSQALDTTYCSRIQHGLSASFSLTIANKILLLACMQNMRMRIIHTYIIKNFYHNFEVNFILYVHTLHNYHDHAFIIKSIVYSASLQYYIQ